ncbi:Uncharacterized protein QTN25_000516 [Entamoeba marina]
MTLSMSLEGQLGELVSKERNCSPRVCHIQLTRIKAKVPYQTPKSFLISVCSNKSKSSIRGASPIILTPEIPFLQLNISITFTYLHSFKENNNNLIIRLHKLKKPNVVYAQGVISLVQLFYSGYDSDVIIKGNIEKKNLGKELLSLTCNIDTTPLEYNHQHDLTRWETACHDPKAVGTSNGLEALDIFFDAAENMNENSSESEENSTPQTPDRSQREKVCLSRKIQFKIADVRESNKSREELKDRHKSIDDILKFRSLKSEKSSKKSALTQSHEAIDKKHVEVSDDSTETEDIIQPLHLNEDSDTLGDQIHLLMNITKRRTSRFYEAFGGNIDIVFQQKYQFHFVSSSEDMKKTLLTFFGKAQVSDTPLKIVLCGSDAFLSSFIRFYCDIFTKKSKNIGHMLDLFYVPIGKTCEIASILSISSLYHDTFCSNEWNALFNSREKINQPTASEIITTIDKYVQTAKKKVSLQLGEVQLSTSNQTTIIPFLKSVELVAKQQEGKQPIAAIDLVKQKKDKQHVSKMKKSLYAMDILKLDTINNQKLCEKYGDLKESLLVILRKNDKTQLSCQQLINSYCSDFDDKKKEKKKEKDDKDTSKTSPIKKEEKEDGANVNVCIKAMVSCDDSPYTVYIDGRRHHQEITYTSMKTNWSGIKLVSFSTFN